MDMHNIPSEIVIALISGLYAFLLMLWSKTDKIWKAISMIQKDYVEHDVCSERRKQCCFRLELEHLKNDFKEFKNEAI
ncbi:MAG: hypothetical protein A2020_00645 [Lentisphaerae bacterium GWF2_45_14]|nr:MAG: hypothetical protein A2020_00645 [Lentisphaerae bacterium GWF2_45_14]